MQLPEADTAAGRAGLAALLAEPARALVALDFDGTLSPIVDRPGDARIAERGHEALHALSDRVGTLAVVTGRPADVVVDLGGLADVPRLTVLGHYGLQHWRAGRLSTPEPAPGVEAVRAALPELVAAGPDGVTVEDKTHSLVVHTRGAPDPGAALDALRAPLAELAARHGLECVPGRFVLELRPPGVDKGAALRRLAGERPPAAVLYAGDDLGDLPAFAAVRELRAQGIPGLTVAAASDELTDLTDEADLVLDGPDAVVAFLHQLAAAIGDLP